MPYDSDPSPSRFARLSKVERFPRTFRTRFQSQECFLWSCNDYYRFARLSRVSDFYLGNAAQSDGAAMFLSSRSCQHVRVAMICLARPSSQFRSASEELGHSGPWVLMERGRWGRQWAVQPAIAIRQSSMMRMACRHLCFPASAHCRCSNTSFNSCQRLLKGRS